MAEFSLTDVEHQDIKTNGVTLHTVTAGPTRGDPVVLLHGFPEFWYGWRQQIPALADAGYRVIAPDQRGYNRSEKPTGINAYARDTLAADAVGLLDALGYNQARFVGHDWGAGITWQILLRYPDRVKRAVPMNNPHPAVFLDFLSTKPRQRLKSWYFFVFMIPKFPEWAWSVGDWRGLRWFLNRSGREDIFTEEELDRYRAAWSQPGAVTGMLNWYRAAFRANVEGPPTMVVDPPTMLIWGTEDAFLHRGMAQPSIEQCSEGRLELLEGVPHRVQHVAPDRVNELLLDFLGKD